MGHCCFLSEQKDQTGPLPKEDMMMWSHYGNGLRGFRVSYDIDKLLESLPEIGGYFINYVNEPEKINVTRFRSFIGDPSGPRFEHSTLEHAFLTKHEAWRYESEFRLRHENCGKIGFDPEAIESITFGEKMPDPQVNILKKILQAQSQDIKFYNAKVSTQNYEIKYLPTL